MSKPMSEQAKAKKIVQRGVSRAAFKARMNWERIEYLVSQNCLRNHQMLRGENHETCPECGTKTIYED